jgi:hypothetical protein
MNQMKQLPIFSSVNIDEAVLLMFSLIEFCKEPLANINIFYCGTMKDFNTKKANIFNSDSA